MVLFSIQVEILAVEENLLLLFFSTGIVEAVYSEIVLWCLISCVWKRRSLKVIIIIIINTTSESRSNDNNDDDDGSYRFVFFFFLLFWRKKKKTAGTDASKWITNRNSSELSLGVRWHYNKTKDMIKKKKKTRKTFRCVFFLSLSLNNY